MERVYETAFIISPDLEEEERDALLERIRNVITDNEGEIVDEKIWGNRNLAYELKNYRSGFYTIISFKGESELVNELERNFKIIDNVLRYLIVRKDD